MRTSQVSAQVSAMSGWRRVSMRVPRALPLRCGFGQDRSGAVMLEAAIVMLVLVPLLLGLSELSEALTLKRRVETAAATAADLVTRASDGKTSISKTDLDQIRKVLNKIVVPRSSDDVGLRVVRFKVIIGNDKKKKSKDDGSYSCKFSGSGVAELPADVLAGLKKDDVIVLVETQARFKSSLSRLFPNAITMQGASYFTPRNKNQLDLTKGTPCPTSS